MSSLDCSAPYTSRSRSRRRRRRRAHYLSPTFLILTMISSVASAASASASAAGSRSGVVATKRLAALGRRNNNRVNVNANVNANMRANVSIHTRTCSAFINPQQQQHQQQKQQHQQQQQQQQYYYYYYYDSETKSGTSFPNGGSQPSIHLTLQPPLTPVQFPECLPATIVRTDIAEAATAGRNPSSTGTGSGIPRSPRGRSKEGTGEAGGGRED
mmetsp:Transcript_6811/g.10032  ORF Transcript_6811/g.10032 Transcript_6811/m.10032 type:complete len:214 (+) Transcript_6811:327-968(+)